MRRRRLIPLLALGAIALAPRAGAAASSACPVIDAFADFAALSHRTAAASPDRQLRRFHQDFLPRYADLYTPEAVGLAPGPRLDSDALRALAAIRDNPALEGLDARLARDVASVTSAFERAFPDFRCDFPIYLAPTFGQLDGAGRMVGGRPSLVLGVDMIARVESKDQLPVFLAHELFHRYNFQVAGFSDDEGGRGLIWRTLWAEGLATYVSARLNPDRPLSDALILPRDLEARAAPLTAMLAKDLIDGLDRVDPRLYGEFFEYGDKTAAARGIPWRSGYYIGYLVARDLGRTQTLEQLAHMQGPELRKDIRQALESLTNDQALLH
jgi:hypothetical protein